MKYKVTWVESAEEKLAHLWMGSRSASKITAAADWLDAALARDPLEVGESRPANVRIAFRSPLAIHFLVNQANESVDVVDVWLF